MINTNEKEKKIKPYVSSWTKIQITNNQYDRTWVSIDLHLYLQIYQGLLFHLLQTVITYNILICIHIQYKATGSGQSPAFNNRLYTPQALTPERDPPTPPKNPSMFPKVHLFNTKWPSDKLTELFILCKKVAHQWFKPKTSNN